MQSSSGGAEAARLFCNLRAAEMRGLLEAVRCTARGVVAAIRRFSATGILPPVIGRAATLVNEDDLDRCACLAALARRAFDLELTARDLSHSHPEGTPVFTNVVLAT